MSDAQPIDQLFAEMQELRAVLDDFNVKYVTIAANGHWSYEKLGRSRHGSDAIDRGQILRIAALIPSSRPMRSGEWALRKYAGVAGPSILIERLPAAVADRLPQEVLANLKRRIKQSGNGVLVGEPGSGKGALLLWLALQIPEQPVLYVAENPPSEFPGTHVMHMFPPSTPAERRALERFVRLSPAVMWDRVVHPADLQTLYGYPGAQRRWFTTDASSVRSALTLLTAAAQNGCDARFSTMLHLASSVIGRPEARNLLLRTETGWSEPWAADESVLHLLDVYDTSDIRRLGPTEVSTPFIDPLPLAKIEVAEEFVAEAESVAEPVLIEPSTAKSDEHDEHPLTIEVEIDDPVDREEAITGMIPRDDIRELQDQGLVPDDSNERPALKVHPGIPETTKSYVEAPDEIHNETTNPAAYLNSILPGLDLEEHDDDSATSAVNLEDLRITTMEELSDSDLEILEEVQQLASDFSGVFEADLDFESLAEEMMSEISDATARADGQATLGATAPDRLVIIESEIATFPAAEDPNTDRTVAGGEDILRLAEKLAKEHNPTEDPDDSTSEFSLNDRIMMLRQRRKDE